MLFTRAQTLLAPVSTTKNLSGQSHKDEQTSSFGDGSPAIRDQIKVMDSTIMMTVAIAVPFCTGEAAVSPNCSPECVSKIEDFLSLGT